MYVPLTAMPRHDGAPAMKWLTGETALFKDVLGGDLVGFFAGDNSLHAAVSSNDGDSWSWIDPGANVAIPAPSSTIQDPDGNVHVLYAQWTGANYARLVLQRDTAGHVTGFEAEVAEIVLPVDLNSNMDIRCQLFAGTHQDGNPALFYAAYDDPASSARGRISAGKTTANAGYSPGSSSDFVSLSDTTGSTNLFTGNGDELESSHENSVHLAQHPTSGDLWFQWGPIDTCDSITQNTNPVMRRRAIPSSAQKFTLEPASIVEEFNQTAPSIASMSVTPNYVWMMRFSPTDGLVIDRVGANGTVATNVISSPFSAPHSGGYVSLTVDALTETRAFAGGWISYDSEVGSSFWAAYYDGETWKTFRDRDPGDTWGVGRSMGWDNGLVLIQLDPSSFAPSMASIRVD